jgi:hypothetical protein
MPVVPAWLARSAPLLSLYAHSNVFPAGQGPSFREPGSAQCAEPWLNKNGVSVFISSCCG